MPMHPKMFMTACCFALALSASAELMNIYPGTPSPFTIRDTWLSPPSPPASCPTNTAIEQQNATAQPEEPFQPLALPLTWTINTNTFLESAPTLADLNGDGTPEIIVAGREELIALDGTGKELWRWKGKGRFMTYPSVLTRPGTPALIYAGDFAGFLSCIDGTGKPVWETKLDAPSDWSASVIADLAGLGKPCVIQTDIKGGVGAYDALTGKPIWKTTVPGQPVTPAVGDLDGDGKSEIAIATGAGNLVLLAYDGTLRWKTAIGGVSQSWSTSSPILFKTGNGAFRIAAGTSNGDVACFDANGIRLWQYATQTPIASGLSAAPGKNGETGLYVATQSGKVYQFSETGEVRWNIDIQGRCLAAGALVDLQGDGNLEYLLATQTGHFMVLNPSGETVFEHQFDTRTINVTPACGRFGNEIRMVLTGGESGKVFCFSAPLKGDVLKAPWAQYRGSETKSGTMNADVQAARITPANLRAENLLIGESVCFDIFNPTPGTEPLKATVKRSGPSNETQIVTTQVIGNATRLEMPLKLSQAGSAEFKWMLQKKDGTILSEDKARFDLHPLDSEKRFLETTVSLLNKTADTLSPSHPSAASALKLEATALNVEGYKLDRIREERCRQAIAEGLCGNAFSLTQDNLALISNTVHRVKQARQIADIVKKAAGLSPSTSLVAFESTLWDNRQVERQLPERVDPSLRIARRVVPGEHEAIAIGLFNITDRELVVRIPAPEPPKDPAMGMPTLRLLHSVPVISSQGEPSWDALPEIDSSRTLTIPSLGMRELWVDADFANQKPGMLNVALKLQVLNGMGVLEAPANPQKIAPPETLIELAFNILPFTMAPDGACRLCAWASYTPANIRDLLAHGNNVFVCPISEPQYDAQGVLAGFNYEKQDMILDALKGHDAVVLANGIPALKADKQSPQFAADMKRFIEDQARHVAEKGFDKNHFAFYPVDEPGGGGWEAVNRVIEFGKHVKAADPQLTVYIDGGGEKPMFEAMKPYVSIWTPGIYQLPEKSPEMDVMRSAGQLWSYNCGYNYARPVGPNCKNINIVAEYRLAAPFVFRYGATGLGFWSYNLGEDLWTRTEMEYPLVYASTPEEAPVTSRRWEGVREGVEDYRILTALRTALNTPDKPVSEEARMRLRHLLETSLPAHFDQSYEEMRIGLNTIALNATNNDRKVNALRAEMMDCIELLAP